MFRVGKVLAWAFFCFGILFGFWGLYGTIAPPANGGYEVTRFIAKTGAAIAIIGLGWLIAVRRFRR